MRFIHKNGRIIPIRDSYAPAPVKSKRIESIKSRAKLGFKGGANIGAGYGGGFGAISALEKTMVRYQGAAGKAGKTLINYKAVLSGAGRGAAMGALGGGLALGALGAAVGATTTKKTEAAKRTAEKIPSFGTAIAGAGALLAAHKFLPNGSQAIAKVGAAIKKQRLQGKIIKQGGNVVFVDFTKKRIF